MTRQPCIHITLTSQIGADVNEATGEDGGSESLKQIRQWHLGQREQGREQKHTNERTHLVKRPREAAGHPVLLRERCLVAEGVRVVVRHNRLACRIEQVRRVTAVIPAYASCQ